MNTNKKILILTANYGNGHMQVAKTLYDECKSQGFEHVIVSNLYQESNPIVSEVTQYLYLKSFSIGKQFYRLFYYGVDKIYNKRKFNIYLKMGNKRLDELIQLHNPDIIIITFPMIVVPEYRNKTGKVIPTFNVMTDFCLHKIWVHENIDRYYVATDYVKQKLVEIGTHPSDVKVTGIPIRPQFEVDVPKSIIYKKYGLSSDKKVLLIMAGAHGVLKNVKELCEALLLDSEVQIVVVCGKNAALKQSLSELEQAHPNQLKALGYVEQIDELFRVTDCMITKPGGITLTEATAIGVPVILYKPVPGQEKENALFFEDYGAAIVINRHEDILESVTNLLQDEEKLESMKQNIKKLHLKQSSQTILEDIVEQSDLIMSNKSYAQALS
ncbi:diglucosyl diacylglycerol synthase [Bacillus altitudinis MN12]|uniref:Processive diacylglycerol beta-glucosyltransferase n=4 Tax=Bacillus TaxID=1386 RepID=A0A5K1N8E8_BACAB|nr:MULTISPECIES: diglucosyl diacylglycerol synthase [Bacillus]AHL71799.1 diacylglycerol glucosyltransferase [Bacillus pumilus]EMI12011.1 diacylglycerol glucosyltransferase [Bacillus stratosphericus LAMA 585]KMK99916.1 diacylglycerol glucosyltransferase [Bacillus stratosphericus]KQL38650.1 diacylglycerol glucosyltransferase [Bacillus sp. FJAT-21955]MBW3700153.1 diglucosyl diacylglycerol synthase [Bacillus aerophilus]MDH8710708.1 processive 1,2-diacylglycerol beta-glucosyltransferase [Micromono